MINGERFTAGQCSFKLLRHERPDMPAQSAASLSPKHRYCKYHWCSRLFSVMPRHSLESEALQ
jgi:hypothetical protein